MLKVLKLEQVHETKSPISMGNRKLHTYIDHVVTMAWSMVKLVKSMTTALRIGDEEWTVY